MSYYVAWAISIILIYVCYTDMRYRLIYNQIVILVFALSLLLAFLNKDNANYAINIYAPLAILVIGFILNFINMVGAGDVKLLVALTIGLSNESVYKLLMLVALAGLPVAIIAYIVHKLRKNSPRCEVPYGVAIAMGYWVLLLSF
jgi:prepilin peptidase CpaA